MDGGTGIKPCTCQHTYQDEKYGKGQRVHNGGKGKAGENVWICTVCGVRK